MILKLDLVCGWFLVGLANKKTDFFCFGGGGYVRMSQPCVLCILKGVYVAFYATPIAELRSVTCHIRSQCYLTQVNTPHLNSAKQASTQFTCPGGIEG